MFFHGSHADLASSIDAIGAGFAIYEYVAADDSFMLVSCNKHYESLLSGRNKELLNQNLRTIFPRYISQPLQESFYLCMNKKSALENEILIDYKGTERYWRSIISPVQQVKNANFRIIQTCVEITERKVLEKKLSISMSRFEAVVRSAYDGIIAIDADQHIKLINDAALHIFGYREDEVIGSSLSMLLPHKYREHHPQYVEGFKNSHVDSRPMQTRTAVRGLRKDGSEFPVEIAISKIHVENSIELTAVVRDISEKNKLLEELLVASREDPLTRLANRRHFSEMLTSELSRFRRFKHPFCLLMLDLDFFKNINDNFGHEAGDQALIAVTENLKELLRETDMIGRWGGEEFLVLLPEVDIERGLEVAEKIRASVSRLVVHYQGNDIGLSVSIGIKEYADEHMTMDQLVDAVDKHLYRAKSEGRNRVCY